MEGCKPPPDMQFSGNVDEAWRNWKQLFTIYMMASGKGERNDKEKIAIMLNMIGMDGIKVYNSFDYQTDSDRNSYEIVMTMFDKYCAPRKNLVYEHFNFFARSQKDSETTDQYYTELKHLAGSCEFAERDVMIRDRLVLGTKHKNLQEKMLGEPDLSMEKAVEFLRNYERTKLIATEIQKSGESEVQAIMLKSKWRPVDKSLRNERPPTKREPVSRYSAIKTCNDCGYQHGTSRCPAFRKKCYKCQGENHFGKMCRQRTVGAVEATERREAFNGEDEDTDDEATIYALQANNAKDWHVVIKMGEHRVKFKVDTGAQVSVINVNIYKQLKTRQPIQATSKRLVSYSGHTIEVMGVVNVMCERHRDRIALDFYVVKDEASVSILGLPAIRRLGLITEEGNSWEGTPTLAAITMSHPERLIEKYKNVFEGQGALQAKYTITMSSEAKPVAVPPRSIPIALQGAVKQEIERMVRDGRLVPVTGPTEWCSPITVVKKSEGRIRICMDPRNLNQYVCREKCWIPTPVTIFGELAKARYFTVLDAANAFHQICLDRRSSELCTIATPYGRYRYTRLPYGLSSAPEVFQQAITNIIGGTKGALNYIDDILVYGETYEDHNKSLAEVLHKVDKAGLKLSRPKMQLAQTKIKFLGHIVSSEGIQVDPEKVTAIQNLKEPKTKKELQRFLGIITYLSRHIPGLSEQTAPLRAILSKKNLWQWEQGGPEGVAFQRLKQMVTEAPILRHYEPEGELKLSVDASKHGLGAVMLQRNSPIAYASVTLTEAQQRYNQIEKELLAVVYAVEHFHYYTYGREVLVETDHRPLLAIVKKPIDTLSPRLQRLVLRLIRYTVQLVYIPGKSIQVADALSREPSQAETNTDYLDQIVMEGHLRFASTNRQQELRKKTKEDEELKVLMHYCKEGWPEHYERAPEILQKYWEIQSDLVSEDGFLYKGSAIFIPVSARKELLEILHSSHQGVTSCKARARGVLYWPRMMSDIEEWILSCHKCQSHARKNNRETLTPHAIPGLPWDKVAIDFKTVGQISYAIMVDYYSKFVIVKEMRNKTAEAVNKMLQGVFQMAGIPTIMFSDNGPPFDSEKYKEFLRQNDIIKQTSSPGYPESNGLVERNVQTVKSMIDKSGGRMEYIDMAVLNHNATPKNALPSPAEMFMGRRLRTLLPTTQLYRTPNYDITDHYNRLKVESEKMKLARPERKLPELANGQQVYVQTGPRSWSRARVESAGEHNSYNVAMPNGRILRRNRLYIRPGRDRREHLKTQIKSEPTDTMGEQLKQEIPTTEGMSPESNQQEDKTREYTTRSGRIVREPERLDL